MSEIKINLSSNGGTKNTIEKQVNELGYTLGDNSLGMNKMRLAILGLAYWDIITSQEMQELQDRLHKKIIDKAISEEQVSEELVAFVCGYKKMVKETWQTYPDIYYESEIKNIEFSDNYATVFVKETAIATPVEQIEDFKTVGELYSISKCVYHLEKHGAKWLINSEKIIEETSTLKYGKARLIDIELNAPKQIGSGKYYTSTLKMDLPEDTYAVASISKEKIIYPQNKAEDAFRNMNNDNILERVFLSNNENVNEYTIASIALSKVENISNDQVQLSLSGLAFIMTRVNVVPENKFIKEENDGKGK